MDSQTIHCLRAAFPDFAASTEIIGILEGAEAIETEYTFLDGVVAGTAAANKAVVLGASGEIDSISITTLGAAVTGYLGIVGGPLIMERQTIDMAAAQVALVFGAAGAGEETLTGNILRVDAGGSSQDLLLPPEANSDGLMLLIYNMSGAGENIVVKEDSDSTTIDTLVNGEMGIFFCDGTLWSGMNEA
jgi:hypothetical protein